MTTLRTFVAVPLPTQVQTAVFTVAQALSRVLPAVRWSRRAENLHVTVQFLGQMAEDRLPQLGSALDQALGALPRFAIAVRGIGAFPSAHKASVVWAGVQDLLDVPGGHDDQRGLAAVAKAVEGVAARFGVPRSERPFRGHVTVGRCRDRGGVDARSAIAPFAEQPFGSLTVDNVDLYESRLGGAGSTYILRSRAALGAPSIFQT